jgi:hypothetical protein
MEDVDGEDSRKVKKGRLKHLISDVVCMERIHHAVETIHEMSSSGLACLRCLRGPTSCRATSGSTLSA